MAHHPDEAMEIVTGLEEIADLTREMVTAGWGSVGEDRDPLP